MDTHSNSQASVGHPDEMAGRAPMIIVLSLGTAALGGPDVMRALHEFAGQSPVVDITFCVLVIGLVTTQLLAVVMLARFVRKAPAAEARRRRAPATDLFGKMTLTVSVGVAFLVTACLAVVSGAGLMTSVFDFFAAGKKSLVLLLCLVHLLRVFRAAPPAARATDRFADTTRTVCLTVLPLIGIYFLLVGVPGGKCDARSV